MDSYNTAGKGHLTEMDIISEDDLKADFVPYFVKSGGAPILYGSTYHLSPHHITTTYHHHISPYFNYYIQFYNFTFFYVRESNARSTNYRLGLQVYRSTGLRSTGYTAELRVSQLRTIATAFI